jgi:hypothetical protein
VAAILFGLEKRGLSLRLNEEGDGLKLSGPPEARTDRIKDTLKAAKSELIAYLRDQARAEFIAEYGQELADEGEAVEADLLRRLA